MNAQPSHVNLVSTEIRAPDSARVLPASTAPSELLDTCGGPSFALRKTIPAEAELEGPPSVGSIGARLAERESQRSLVAAPVSVAEPAVARAKEKERSRIFSPTVLVFAAALAAFAGFAGASIGFDG